ncbi:efflux RND transporter periplasmic adaptor subunit [Nitratireductor soli]|uniref:efflux RND transporter periplasmic adaptor subunit n=1 Tax=Nitratireductor soli TaxID=1670619 RepID=UPI00065DDE46|nr:efflux RND transporter periplasmic adaptor subunit [Nitratireductor soli]
MQQTGRRPKQSTSETSLPDTPEAAKSFPRAKILALFGVALLASAAYVMSGTGEATPDHYAITPVMRGDLIARIATTATLRPLTQVDISSELNGAIQAVFVRENQQVMRGDILAKLDTTSRTLDVESAEASVTASQARLSDAGISLSQAEQNLTRALALSKGNAIAAQKLDEITATRARAANQVKAAEADLAIKRVDLELKRLDLTRSTLRAPINGVVLARRADPGQTVVASTQAPVLFTLAQDLARMELIAKINEADIGAIDKGQKASFTVDAFPERVFEAAIRDVSYAHKTENNIVTYEARLDVSNADLALRPGMTASVSIITGETKDALLVPSSSLRYHPASDADNTSTEQSAPSLEQHNRVYILRDGKPQAVRVETGVRNWEKTEILSGLADGTSVITADGEADLVQ